LYQGTTLVGPLKTEESGFSPCYGASCTKCSSRESYEQRTGVLRHNQNQLGTTVIAVGTECNASHRVLRTNVATGKFQMHDFVIMPDHVHLLMTLPGDVSVEKAMQLIKGGFSYRLRGILDLRERCGNVGFLRCGLLMERAFWSTARISFRTLSKRGSSIVLSSGPIVTVYRASRPRTNRD
jgi:REP element-mobilizing transposase RayT